MNFGIKGVIHFILMVMNSRYMIYLKKIRFLIVVSSLLILAGCISPIYSPRIKYQNLSHYDIKNVSGNWAGHRLLKVSTVWPGKAASQTFPVWDVEDLFGTLNLTWENASGNRFEKSIEITEDTFPTLKKKGILLNKDGGVREYIRFEFTQDGIDYYTNNTPNELERRKRGVKIMQQVRLDNIRKEEAEKRNQ